MKKLLVSIVLVIASVCAFAQSTPCTLTFTCTPNLQFQIPPFGTANWNVPVNANFTNLDLFLSGGLPIPALNVTGQLQAPQLTTWSSQVVYGQGAVVFFLGTQYTSLIAANSNNIPSTSPSDWTTATGTFIGGVQVTNTPTAVGQKLTITSLSPLQAAWQ
jgi:hypothetical protein